MYFTSVARGIIFSICFLLFSPVLADQACKACHQTQVQRWQQSHHFRAMNEATPEFVLGDFSGTAIHDRTMTFSLVTENNQYWLVSQDKHGNKSKEKIHYTFGVHPLQQYLTEVEPGKFQFIPLAWDGRKKSEGGQRWFVLHDQQPTQEFHHSQMGQNWNHMCADCHSTGFKKNFSADTQQFNSEFQEINVSCQACHGDARQHLVWAQGTKNMPDKGFSHSLAPGVLPAEDKADSLIESVADAQPSKQIEVCATCHARRQQLQDRQGTRGFWDTYSVALLTSPLYHVDGQILEEVYVWGSFLQSKMYAAGVTCSNCHDPHSGELKFKGNQTCNQCHAASKFDTPQHHGHPLAGPGSQCVDCHMPATTYMAVDPRRDHSLRIPRPDLTLETEAPNVCTTCHQDKSAQWAVTAIKRWHPNSKHIGQPHFSQAFHAADQGLPKASEMLSRIAQDSQYNDIIRASALARMESFADQNALIAIQRAVREKEPLKRLGAISAARAYPMPLRYELLAPLLIDSRLTIRVGAARAVAAMLSPAHRANLSDTQMQILQQAVDEYRQTEQYHAERGYSHTNLGNLALDLHQYQQAEHHYRKALEVEPIYLPAYINLADLLRRQGSEKPARSVLMRAQSIAPDDPDINYALAMSWIRDNNRVQAGEHLRRSAQFGNAGHKFTYGLLLKEQGETDAALIQLERAHALKPNQFDINYVLAQLYIEKKAYPQAMAYARNLAKLAPDDPQMRKLIEQLQLLEYINQGQ